MKILVTGAAGFIGSYLCQELLNLGHQVIGLDNLSGNYYDAGIKKERLDLLTRNILSLELTGKSIENLPELLYFFKSEQFDVVYHLAAYASIPDSRENPKRCLETNILGFYNILECCRQTTSVNHLYFIRASGNLDNMYLLSKQMNEVMSKEYSERYQMKITGIRFSSVYGEYGRPDMAVWKFTDAVMNEKPIVLYGGERVNRDFTHVKDAIRGIISIDHIESSLHGYNEFDIGSYKQTSLIQLIRLIEKYTGKRAIIQNQPSEGYAPEIVCKKDSRLEGWYQPMVSIENGIRKFVEWYAKR